MQAILSAIDFPRIHPELVRIGPLAIRWYGLAYVAGFVVGYFQLLRMANSGQLTAPLGWLVVGVLAGGRLGWWLF